MDALAWPCDRAQIARGWLMQVISPVVLVTDGTSSNNGKPLGQPARRGFAPRGPEDGVLAPPRHLGLQVGDASRSGIALRETAFWQFNGGDIRIVAVAAL